MYVKSCTWLLSVYNPHSDELVANEDAKMLEKYDLFSWLVSQHER